MAQDYGSLRSQSAAVQGPGLDAELTFTLSAGRLLRRRVREMVEGQAMLLGLSVECREARGFFDSTFYFKATGKGENVVTLSRSLTEWQQAMNNAKGT